jgi:hypothetical protein
MMGESGKAVCALVLFIGIIATITAWLLDKPGSVMWGVRIGAPIASGLAVGLLLKAHNRADLAPDFLRKIGGNYFNRGGFCFACNAVSIDGICYLVAYFQNQYDQPCKGRIALRPVRGFFMRRPKIEMVTFEIDCEPGAFGFARIPVPLSKEFHGKRQSFEVGASVDYPQGKGRKLRFQDGIILRADSDFGNKFATAVAMAGVLTGHIMLTRPATAKFALPANVAEVIPPNMNPEMETLWRLGDPELENVG